MDAKKLMERAIKFHGHSCPGLAIGVMAAKYVLEQGNNFSADEEMVAVVENDNCSVDALQVLLGTTFGKGNLIFLDYGKNSYSIFNRTSEKALRLSVIPGKTGDRNMSKDERTAKILGSDPAGIFNIKEIEFNPPDYAKIRDSDICEDCGEAVMSTRIKEKEGKKLCISCHGRSLGD